MKTLKIGIAMDYDAKGSSIPDADTMRRLSCLNAEPKPIFEPMIKNLESFALDALILPGSPMDVDPKLYGEEKRYAEVKVNPLRQDLDWRLIEKAIALKIPILGICFGMQILNVFFGGSLYQHIPAELPNSIEHEQKTDKYRPSHEVFLEKNGHLFQEFKTHSWQVNSTHHQGIKVLGKDLRVEATAHDGLIEAFMHEGEQLILGVEWHPERLSSDQIIPYFLKACRR